ncbi:MAG: phage portal protein, partial [Planctomycetota bacterium]
MRSFDFVRRMVTRLAGRRPVMFTGRSLRSPASRFQSVRARYDAAQTTGENRRHWAGADRLSADAAANAQVRGILRARARYEVANNSYAKGIVLTLANDMVGTGPRLQMLTDDAETNTLLEREFAGWAECVGLTEKLRTMRMARAVDGEAFALLVANPKLDVPVKLDVRLVEADQVASPFGAGLGPGTRGSGVNDFSRVPSPTPHVQATDGIVLDRYGNPVEYHILKHHPGDDRALGLIE